MADTKPVPTDAFAAKTGRDWAGWLAFLEGIGARGLSHTEIAAAIAATGDASSWWAQSITVAYEQHVGRRRPGQRSSGAFEVSVTRTMGEDAAALFSRLAARFGAAKAFGGVAAGGDARISETPKRRYWRVTLADGTTLQLSAEPKGAGRTLVGVTHARLAAEADIAAWREFWKEELGRL